MKHPVSLVALRTFVEVARMGSMKSAAASLGVTAGAISQQVRSLELRLKTQLFHRSNRDVVLTEHGYRLLASINKPFQEIEGAVASFHYGQPRNQTLVVTTVPSFAACWLVPRLGRFSALYPGIEVRIETSVDLVDLRLGGVDIAIRHGTGNYHGLDALHLVTPHLIAICSPQFLKEKGPITDVRDCLNLPLLQDRNRADWKLWFEAHGVEGEEDRTVRGACYPDDALLIEAAAEGQGLAVVRDVYALRALDCGRVIKSIDLDLSTSNAYFFVTTAEMAGIPRVRAFRHWLVGEFATMQTGIF